MINYAIAERPADMTITTHVCRGNFRSTWISSGGYEPVAETLLAGTNYDGYFLEYDSERAGGFEPLRYLPKGNKIVVVGVITSKSGELENKDDIKRRLEEASKFAPLDQLALSPQCGFASTEEGNILTEEEQWAKLQARGRRRERGVGEVGTTFPRSRFSPSNGFEFPIGEPHHFQEQPAVAEARDLGFAEGARLVVDRHLDDFQVLLGGAEDQIEVAERIEVAEIVALARDHLVVLAQQHLGAAQRVGQPLVLTR